MVDSHPHTPRIQILRGELEYFLLPSNKPERRALTLSGECSFKVYVGNTGDFLSSRALGEQNFNSVIQALRYQYFRSWFRGLGLVRQDLLSRRREKKYGNQRNGRRYPHGAFNIR